MKDYNPFSLSGKTILVTGASSGIGKAAAIECSRMGAKIVLTARKEEALKEVLGELEGEGHSYLLADVTDEEQLKALAEQVPPLDGFVCNAGVGCTKPIAFFKKELIEKIFVPNIEAPMLLTKHLVKLKKLRKGASIVFTSSISAKRSTVGNGIYAASKAALSSFMKTCANEFAPKGIRANAVLPGMVETKLITPGVIDAEDQEKDKQHYLLGRYGKPEEVAYAMVYLLSDAAAWVTGTEMLIEGGTLSKK